MRALIQNNTVAQFPYSETQFRRDNPRTSFPKKMTLPVDAQNGTLVAVTQADRPTTTDAQTAVPETSPTLIDGVWTLGWTIRDKTPEEIQAEREAMWSTRAKFALSAYNAGIITATEAEAWAGGTSLPQVVIDAFDTNIQDAGERLAARIDALTAANIHRVNPLILLLQTALNLTDEQADQLFT